MAEDHPDDYWLRDWFNEHGITEVECLVPDITGKEGNSERFKDIKFFIPKEGTQLWVDTMAIPAHSPYPTLANKFINFFSDAKIGAKLSNWTHYASPNKASQPMLDKQLRKPPHDASRKRDETFVFHTNNQR